VLRLAQAQRPLPLKREFPGDHLEESDGEGIDVGAVIDPLAEHLLRRHIDQRAGGEAFLVARADDRRQPEIGEVRRAEAVEQDVGRLEVAVDDVPGVGALQRLGHRLPDADDLVDRQPAMTVDNPIQQRAARHIAHDDVKLALELAEVVDRQDVGVLQRGDGARLALKLEPRLLVGQVGHDRLDGDGALQPRVPRRPDVGHPAAPDVLHHRIRADLIPDLHRRIAPAPRDPHPQYTAFRRRRYCAVLPECAKLPP